MPHVATVAQLPSSAATGAIPLLELLVRDVVTAHPTTPTGEVLHQMQSRRISCVVIVEAGQPVGIFTERDAVRQLAAGYDDPIHRPIAEVMSRPVVTVLADLDFHQAFHVLIEGHFRHLVVVDEQGQLEGIVTEGDFLQFLSTNMLLENRTVASVMSRELLTATTHASVAEALHAMAQRGVGCVLVTQDTYPVGILTERDAVTLADTHPQFSSLPLSECMSRPVRTIIAGRSLQEAARLMRQAGIRRLVVVDEAQQLLGMVTRHDVVQALEGRYIGLLQETIEAQRSALEATRDRLQAAERQLLYRSVMDQMTDAILLVEVADGTLLEVNESACLASGYNRAELIGMGVWQLSELISDAGAWVDLSRSLVERGNAVFETEHRRKDGSLQPVEVSVRHIRSNGRDLLLAVVRDITERRRAEQALRERELHLNTLIEALPEAIYFKDGRGAWQVVNARGLALFHLTDHPWQGRSDHELAEQNPHLSGAFAACIASDEAAWAAAKATPSEERVTGEDGAIRIMDVVKVPLFYPDGSRKALVVVGRDVTDQRAAEERLRASETSYRGLFDSVTEAIYIQEPNGRFIDVNSAAEAMYGYPREHFRGQTPEFLAAPEMNDLEAVAAALDRAFAGEPQQISFWGRRRNGEIFPKEMSLSAAHYFGQRVIIAVSRDVSERHRADAYLRQAAAVYACTSEGVVITDRDTRIVAVNDAFTTITGYQQHEVVGRTPTLLNSGRHDASFFRRLWRDLQELGSWRGEIWNRRKNGEVFPEWLTIRGVRNDSGQLTHYVGVFSDLTLIKHSEAQLNELAHYDPLTALPNRLLLNSRLGHALEQARRQQHRMAVLFLDLDRFKNLNDSLGHPAGDELLVNLAHRLREVLGAENTLSRHGGDEFVVLIESVARPDEVATVADTLLRTLREPFILSGGHEVFASASIGISLYPDDGDDPNRLVRNADAAMYQAKNQGGNSYHFYTGALTQAARERLSLETRLRRAIEREELELLYQPQVDLASGQIIGTEALVRWRSPDEGLVLPGRFVSIAEETGLIIPLGEWVLREACRAARAWQLAGAHPIVTAVNLSSRQFRDPQLRQVLRGALQGTALPPALLEIEITESTMMEQCDEVASNLEAIKGLGVQLAIDDFGTGYSSLAALKTLTVDKLKIDRSFVQEIPDDLSDMEIAATIIAMGRNLGLKVLAEGVETQAQLDFLRMQGCHAGQGFLWSRPISSEAMLELLLRAPR